MFPIEIQNMIEAKLALSIILYLKVLLENVVNDSTFCIGLLKYSMISSCKMLKIVSETQKLCLLYY